MAIPPLLPYDSRASGENLHKSEGEDVYNSVGSPPLNTPTVYEGSLNKSGSAGAVHVASEMVSNYLTGICS